MANQVVAHCLDGRLIRGTSLDVALTKRDCHIRTPDQETIEIQLADLKALYFVKSLTGDPAYQYASEPAAGDPRLAGSHRILITFRDGERLAALSNRYPLTGNFFFVLPLDGGGNTIRILVNRAAVVEMQQVGDEKA